MKVLITGGDGQLGYELKRTVPTEVELVGLETPRLDITNPAAVAAAFEQHAPNAVINAAAYTAVDRAEHEQAAAYAVNADGAQYLAERAAAMGSYFVQVSTDFVFDGSASRPYLPKSSLAPLGVYGASKAEGERRVHQTLGDSALILRTAWVYSAHGRNFVKTMLRLMSEREELAVVADQVGTPTWANGLAGAIWHAVERRTSGIHHWTDAGVASWYDFAVAIEAIGRERGLLERTVRVRPIRTEDYPTPAQRPAYSVLDKTATVAALAFEPEHWRAALARMLAELSLSDNPSNEFR